MQTTITVTGMTCTSCADSTQAALNALPGVEAEVSYDQGRAVIMRPGEVGTERLLETIRAKGSGVEKCRAGCPCHPDRTRYHRGYLRQHRLRAL